MKFELRNKPLTIFTFASLTDIILQLLIFFLLTSSFITQSGIRIQLPISETREQISDRHIIITLTAENEIYVFGEKVLKGDLPTKLKEVSDGKTDKLVVLRADKNVPIQEVIDVMDISKSVGLTRFVVATQVR
ncbi:biopolymer transport protein ExbD [Candidatus Kryptonium thompsonii]|uniref:Biopolymer transport protein ExbD n=1 Tax=Candidatus Kryptonium thompsonii TaxID=1633631 RepID=A0A0P1LGH9_9BACT|nr:biopolymer transporter ExbD [Candidatus Kryptonium thompsoni]CUS78083.1 biopolymer transport protein ExbD [Candidatus Kryptonium thompsoni]CUS79199.1 biopolymer transport protein ExbD [Candidatus Kryptonium thompsoni]CUS80807.1 biopolymer transport protein ExbD [Candidatus Kryptonium thompsoni]CUS84174.1 biopolymer transport protein ExbD [Candidatus Kryptonium thompsoni]CUS86251.1 biopolymer transport protein ExbD [Candidatus Kryptonium thompsoni]